MHFGYFTHVWGKPGMQPSDRYQQLWRELELADERQQLALGGC